MRRKHNVMRRECCVMMWEYCVMRRECCVMRWEYSVIERIVWLGESIVWWGESIVWWRKSVVWREESIVWWEETLLHYHNCTYFDHYSLFFEHYSTLHLTNTILQFLNIILRISTLLDHYFTYFFYDIGYKFSLRKLLFLTSWYLDIFCLLNTSHTPTVTSFFAHTKHAIFVYKHCCQKWLLFSRQECTLFDLPSSASVLCTSQLPT